MQEQTRWGKVKSFLGRGRGEETSKTLEQRVSEETALLRGQIEKLKKAYKNLNSEHQIGDYNDPAQELITAITEHAKHLATDDRDVIESTLYQTALADFAEMFITWYKLYKMIDQRNDPSLPPDQQITNAQYQAVVRSVKRIQYARNIEAEEISFGDKTIKTLVELSQDPGMDILSEALQKTIPMTRDPIITKFLGFVTGAKFEDDGKKKGYADEDDGGKKLR